MIASLASWLTYLLPPFLLIASWQIITRRLMIKLYWFPAFLIALVLTYASYVEPRRLLIKETSLSLSALAARADNPKELKVALFSDTRYGIFGQPMPLWRIHRAVNRVRPDIVVIAGDLVDRADPIDLRRFFSELAGFEAPVYMVTGDSDHDPQDRSYVEQIKQAASRFGAQVIDNRTVTFEHEGDTIALTGLPDLKLGSQRVKIGPGSVESDLHLLLAHRPDHAAALPRNSGIDLVMTGHTRGGQIALFGLERWFNQSELPFLMGRHEVNGYPLFITGGIGMALLPLRIGVPPRVDILTLRFI
jgi:predicted MPP superfamily phosphohydrolase